MSAKRNVYHSADGTISFEPYNGRIKPNPKQLTNGVYTCYKINDSGELGYNIILCSGCSNYNSIIIKNKPQGESGRKYYCTIHWKKSTSCNPLKRPANTTNLTSTTNTDTIPKRRRTATKVTPIEVIDVHINQPDNILGGNGDGEQNAYVIKDNLDNKVEQPTKKRTNDFQSRMRANTAELNKRISSLEDTTEKLQFNNNQLQLEVNKKKEQCSRLDKLLKNAKLNVSNLTAEVRDLKRQLGEEKSLCKTFIKKFMAMKPLSKFLNNKKSEISIATKLVSSIESLFRFFFPGKHSTTFSKEITNLIFHENLFDGEAKTDILYKSLPIIKSWCPLVHR